MKTSSRSAVVDGLPSARGCLLACGALTLACLTGCATDPVPQRVAAAPSSDPRAVESDLLARLDALDRQAQPASDDTIALMERALREQREKRARAAASAVAPSPDVAPRPAVSAPPPVTAAAAPPAKPARVAKAPAKSTAVVRPVETEAEAPPAPPAVVVTLSGPGRTPMSRTAESHTPVDELYARARELELRQQLASAIELYREASQRGHAPSSQRLMELYADGAPGVARDYRVAVFFKERAVQQGASFDVWRR